MNRINNYDENYSAFTSGAGLIQGLEQRRANVAAAVQAPRNVDVSEYYRKQRQLEKEKKRRQEIIDEENARREGNRKIAEKRAQLARRKREEEQAKVKAQQEQNDRARDAEYDKWVKDVEVHPENYSAADRKFVQIKKLAEIGQKNAMNPGAQLGSALLTGASKLWFNLKDMLGQSVHNSIAVNGENIASRIGFNKFKQNAANAHQQKLNLQEAADNLRKERAAFSSQNGDLTNPDIKSQYDEYTGAINDIERQLQDPQLRELDDAYKQIYAYNNATVGEQIGNVFNLVKDKLFTYDQYKDYVAKKRQNEQINRFDTTLQNQYMKQPIEKRTRDYANQNDLVQFDRQETSDYTKELEEENKQLAKRYEDNRKHLADSEDYWRVRESYKRGEQLYQNAALWSPNYWMYTMPGMIGSSMSSEAQGRSAAIQTGAMGLSLASTLSPYTRWAAPWIQLIGQVASTPDDMIAMYDENFAETGSRRLSNLETALKDPANGKGAYDQIMDDLRQKSYEHWKQKGISDKYLKEYIFGEEGDKNVLRDLSAGAIQSTDPRVDQALVQAHAGLEAMLQADNVRTGAETVVQKLIMMPGISALKNSVAFKMDKAAGKVLSRGAINEVTTDAAGKATAKTADAAATAATTGARKAAGTKYATGFDRAERTFTDAISSGASTGGAIGDALGFGIAGKAIGSAIGGTISGTAYMGKRMLPRKLRNTYDGIEMAALNKYQKVYDKLMPTKEWKKLALQYGVKTAKASLASSMSEAAEEAVQYLNEKENFANKYGFGRMGIGDLIVNDLAQGGRVLNSYLSLLGIGESELKDDQEYWANVKGGFALGGLHTGVITLGTNIGEGVQQYKTNDAILSSSVMNRELDKMNRASNAEFARQAMSNREGQVLNFLDRMQKEDSRREEPNFTPEDYAEKIKAAKRVMALTKSKTVRQLLEKSGIVYGTEKYAHAIADIYNLQEALSENANQRMEFGIPNIASIYNTQEYRTAINEAADRFIAQTEELRNATEQDREIAKQNFIINSIDANHAVNRLSALIKLRAQHNTIEDFYKALNDKFGIKPMRPDAVTIHKSIEKQIKDAISEMKKLDPEFNAKTDKEILDYVDSIRSETPGVNIEDVELQEQANAMLLADEAVIRSQYSLLGTDKYSRRVDAIMEANDNNKKLDWMVNDIYSGDAVTRLMTALEQEAEQQSRQTEKSAQNETKEVSEPFDSVAAKPKVNTESVLAKNKAKYQERKAKAKQRYERRKNKYKNWRRGNLSASIVPFQDAIVLGANELLHLAEDGVYKFAQLVDDIKDISGNTDLREVLPELKRIYIKQRAKYALKNPEVLNNMSSVDEVNSYIEQINTIEISTDPIGTPLYQQIQNRLMEDGNKVLDKVSSHYDVVVKDGNNITIYKNLQAIEDSHVDLSTNKTIQDLVNSLTEANKSKEEFENKLKELAKYAPGFPIAEYVELRNVDGIHEAIARNYNSWVKGQSLQNGIKVRRATVSILLGKENTLRKEDFPDNFDKFVEDVREIRRKLQGLGLTIISSDKYIYGKNNKGENIASQADIIAADSTGKIYAIDIRSGKDSIGSRYESAGANYRSIKAQTEALLQQIEQILQNKFKKPVNGLYLLPVVYNDYSSDGIKVDVINDRSLIPVKSTKLPQYSNNIEEQKNNARTLVDQINDRINEFNSYVLEASKYIKKYSTKPIISLQNYSSVGEYSLYLSQLQVQYEELENDILNIQTDIQDAINIESTIWGEQTQNSGIDDIPTETRYYMEALESACNDLDIAVQYMPKVKATTQDEKAAVKRVYNTLFEAQKALDDFLQLPEASITDVTNEEELIASVMEILAEHPENFGRASIFTRRWWANNFVIGKGNNTSIGVLSQAQQFAGFINTINSWVDTLNNHVVGDLDNHRQLQIWYSSLLNNYFNELLNNAQRFTESLDNPVSVASINVVIQRGRDLITRFNDTWGAPTDEQFDGPPADDVERINRMPVKWADLYNTSSYHAPAFDAMSINDQYFFMSNQPDFAEKVVANFYISKRGLKYTNPRTGQSYEIKPGDVAVYVEYTEQNGTKHFADFPLITNIKNYPNASTELQNRIAQVNRGNIRFIEKIRSMLDYVAKHPEYKIITSISTNKGTIDYSPVGELHNVSEFLFANDLNKRDLYNIGVTAQDNVGIVTIIENRAAGTRFYDVRTGNNMRHLGNYNDVYQKGDMAVNSGVLVYFYDTGDGQKIGVPMPTITIGIEDAKRLTNLIHRYITGQKSIDGYDILNLLKQRLYIREADKYMTEYNKDSNMITLLQDGVKIGNDTYNVITQKSEIVARIAAMNNATKVDILNQKLLQTNDGVFDVAYRILKSGSSSVTLPNGFTLTLDDFEHNGTGSTVLGYFMRNGIIATRAKGTGYKQINFGNPVLALKSNDIQSSTQPSALQHPQKTSLGSTDDPFDFDFNGLAMTVDENDVVQRSAEEYTGFQKYANDWFNKVLGENKGKIVFTDKEKEYLTRISGTQVAIARATTDFIELTKYSPDEAALHEAFHRIMELLLPDNEREQFYKMYKEHTRYGRKLGEGSERAIAEGLTDLYVDYTTKVIDAKSAPWYKKFFKWCNTVNYLAGLTWNMGIKNTRIMLTLWRNVNAGMYANPKYAITKERIARFEKLFPGGLYYTVKNKTNGHTVNLQHIADSGQLSQMVRALGYYIMEQKRISDIDPDVTNFKIDDTTPNLLFAQDKNGKSIIDNLRGIGLPNDKVTAQHLAFREIFESVDENILNSEGKKVGVRTRYPNFDAISDKVTEYISLICGEYTGKVEEQDGEERKDFGENLDVQNLNIDKYDKASYEINKLEGTTKKVKLFFATIPYTIRDKDGKIVLDTTRNIFGAPTYMPIDEVYNVLENDLHDIKSIPELYNKLKKLAKVSTMHWMVLKKLHQLVTSMYAKDTDGNIIIDYDKEQFAIQIANVLSSQKMDFVIANSKTLPNNRGKEIRISQSSLGRDTYQLPKQWTKFLLSGQVSVFARTRDNNDNLRFVDNKLYPNHTDIFSKTAQFIDDMRQALSTSGVSEIDGIEYNVDSLEDIAKLKKEFVHRLHQIGIIISEQALDHMLLNNSDLGESAEDRDLGRNGLITWLTIGGDTSVNAFQNKLRQFVFPNGSINQSLVKEGYTNIGFVKDLAKWQASYNRVTVDNRTLALNGKELHSISQNNAISRNIDEFNAQDTTSPLVRTLLEFGYNLTDDLKPEGSIILKGIVNHNPNQHITAHTYIGFKTDNKGDSGSEYTEEATVDDYMAKLSMLQEGYMLFPTLADKGTWVILSGVDIPGMRFIKTKENGQEGVSVIDAPTVKFYNKMPYVMPSRAQINQMLEYAHTERLAIQRCMADLGYTDIPGYVDEGRTRIPDSEKIINYHTPNKSTEPNGTRFFGLTQITVKEDGKLVTYNLNDPNKSSKDLLKLANEKFFDKSLEEQADIMATTLHVQNTAAIERAIELGVVTREDVSGEWKDAAGRNHKQEFKSGARDYYTLESRFLNQDQISALTTEIMRSLQHAEFGTWANIPTVFSGENAQYASRSRDLLAEKQFRYRVARGFAIAAILNDVTVRHIICAEEALRCFIGNPAFFKVIYDKSAGRIKDSAYDIQKRIGGLISTGEDNIRRLPGIPDTYTVAECNDYEVASTANVAANLEEMFVDNAIREMYAIKTGLWSEAYSMSIEDIKNTSDPSVKSAIDHAEQNGIKFAKTFTKGINVADGAAYITDTMCENLLRMRGAYNNAVRKAFETLRSDKNWKRKRDAYKIIYDAVNLVPFKYTAYGFREHSSGVSVPYYNKFALFPLFNGIATGKLDNIYQKMIAEGVDELLMTSAVKVGSQGAISYNGTDVSKASTDYDNLAFDVPFNKYVQRFEDLRRQLNTDPEEGDRITAGTQMIKIALQNLRLDRENYVDIRTGEPIDGRTLLHNLMQSINQLAINGALEIQDMFCKEGTSIIDPEKLSTYLNDQLGTRNATKAITEVIQVTEDNNGIKKLVAPLAATPDASWIESIIISTVNKRVIDITTPGSSFTQRSVFAMEGKGKSGEGLIQGDGSMSNTINNGQRLQMLNNDGSMDAVITMDYFDEILFKGKLSNMSFEEKRKWLFDHNIIGQGAKANTIGYRIPTQAQSSIHALRFVDVIPGGKASIILPEEFTKITGSDELSTFEH